MSTRELVDALIAGDSIGIEQSLNSTMSDKLSVALDDYRVQVAQSMFNEVEETPDSEDE